MLHRERDNGAEMLPQHKHPLRHSSLRQQGGRDVFLSHRSTDKELIRQLAADVESQDYKDRKLTTWLDEAEIRPGQSIPAMINEGLEKSRFIALVLTPDYFSSE